MQSPAQCTQSFLILLMSLLKPGKTFLDSLFVALLRGPVINPRLREIILGRVMTRKIVWILIAFSPAEPRGPPVMGVLEMVRNGKQRSFLNVLHRRPDA